MAASLIARSITVSRGPQLVLDSIDVTLSPGRRVGLVGPNGVGKSTLLGALAGHIDIDDGSVDRVPPSATVGLLAQESSRSRSETVREFFGRRTGVEAAQYRLDAATEALAVDAVGASDQYSVALDQWLALGAADFAARVGVVAADLGIRSNLLDRPMDTLSGGEAARCSLASLMLARFDVLLLDEPTNDLDLDGLEHLERWLVGLDTSVMVVSHDRRFLERTITDVVEIDHHSHRAHFYSGGWKAFTAERELARQHARERYAEYAASRAALLGRAQREREWAAQGRAKVRRSDEKDKNIRNFKINQTEQLAGRAARTQRAVERLDVVEQPHEPWVLHLEIPAAGRSGDIVAVANAAVYDRGEFCLGPVDVELRYGDRIALVGPNGSGKTTLVDLLLGRLEPSSGASHLGSNVVIGEIEQARSELFADELLLDVVMAATRLPTAAARTLLAKFGLGADHVVRSATTLSPGERTRASLALLMANGANLLVLDEPTNHLDMEAIEQLERVLDTFDGTVLLVTHDRVLLETVRLTRVFEVRDGNFRELDHGDFATPLG